MSAETLITDNLDLWTGAITKRITSGRGSNKKIELTGIHKLRHLILELACHGKIVPQLASETPACEVLEGLQLRRKELIRKKKIKNSKPLPNVSADEKPSKLPSNWVWTRLGSIAEINPRNSAEDATKASFVPMPLITTSYHGDHGHETKPWRKIKKGYTHFADGDVALAKITPCFENSKAAVFRGLINGLGAGTTELHVARPLSNAVNPYYLILFLKSPRFLIEGEKVMTGSAGQKRVPKDYFSSTPLPLPPTEEQHRIVQKVDELMALCDRLEQQTSDQIDAHDTLVDTLLGTLTQSQNATELAENWTRLAAHFDTLFTTEQSIDKLKQTILQLAVMGLLVEQDAGDKPASDLIQRINAERLRLELKEKVRVAKSPSLGLAFGETEVLPDNWATCALGTCVNLVSGQHLKSDEYFKDKKPGSIPYLTGPAEFGEGEPKPQRHTFERRAVATTGDILITCKGSGVGKLNTASEDIAISRQLMAVRSILVNTHFLYILLDSLRDAIREKVVGIAIPGISRGDILGVNIQLPPIAEQHRIVKKVDELMALCDQLKERLNQASETRCQLAESIVENALQ